ncbi:unnamed protein product [Nyctereutes procyonoides]|uniref:(raccoon dog) hypothetical protein n=1 Tax=Nyctereutes procyonoides TaxID=34880 RepID=A0A811Y6W2_NYCPR|nr:unnamed protein product [Nyctereutes procyonoides]
MVFQGSDWFLPILCLLSVHTGKPYPIRSQLGEKHQAGKSVALDLHGISMLCSTCRACCHLTLGQSGRLWFFHSVLPALVHSNDVRLQTEGKQ